MGSACRVAPYMTPVCVPGQPSGLLRSSFPWLWSKDAGLNNSKICFIVSVDEKGISSKPEQQKPVVYRGTSSWKQKKRGVGFEGYLWEKWLRKLVLR